MGDIAGRIRTNDQLGGLYIQMGSKLSKIPDWEPDIRRESARWITVYYNLYTADRYTNYGVRLPVPE
jgi:hypothetical protein